MKVGMDEVWT